MLGEVKYIFECMVDNLKFKVTVSAIMQLFAHYNDEKIERQRREMEELNISYEKNYMNCAEFPMGKAIIHKMQMTEEFKAREGRNMTNEEWGKMPLKRIAEQIKSGEIRFTYSPDKRIKHIWD